VSEELRKGIGRRYKVRCRITHFWWDENRHWRRKRSSVCWS